MRGENLHIGPSELPANDEVDEAAAGAAAGVSYESFLRRARKRRREASLLDHIEEDEERQMIVKDAVTVMGAILFIREKILVRLENEKTFPAEDYQALIKMSEQLAILKKLIGGIMGDNQALRLLHYVKNEKSGSVEKSSQKRKTPNTGTAQVLQGSIARIGKILADHGLSIRTRPEEEQKIETNESREMKDILKEICGKIQKVIEDIDGKTDEKMLDIKEKIMNARCLHPVLCELRQELSRFFQNEKIFEIFLEIAKNTDDGYSTEFRKEAAMLRILENTISIFGLRLVKEKGSGRAYEYSLEKIKDHALAAEKWETWLREEGYKGFWCSPNEGIITRKHEKHIQIEGPEAFMELLEDFIDELDVPLPGTRNSALHITLNFRRPSIERPFLICDVSSNVIAGQRKGKIINKKATLERALRKKLIEDYQIPRECIQINFLGQSDGRDEGEA